jgi:hypothetical protein
VRAEAARALARLAQRVRGAAEAQALLAHAFADYHGARGQRASSEDKIALLNVTIFLRSLSLTR